MQKTKKRFLSALLACAMIVGLFPFAAFAGDGSNGTTVTTFDGLKDAVKDASTNGETTVINLGKSIEVTQAIQVPSGAKIVINGNDNNLSYDGAATKVVFNNTTSGQTEGVPSNVSLEINKTGFVNTNSDQPSSGYAVIIGGNATNTNVALDECSFENLYCGIYVQAFTETSSVTEAPTFSISNSSYSNTKYGYSVDEWTNGAVVGAVQRTYSTDNTSNNSMPENETWQNAVYLEHEGMTISYQSNEGAGKALLSALADANDGDVIKVLPGKYDIPKDESTIVQGQAGWYLPIQKSVTMMGVDGNGNEITDATQTQATIYSDDKATSGSWANQNFITVFADDVTISGLTIMPNVNTYYGEGGTNKAIEVAPGSKDFTIKNCKLTSNTYANSTDAGSLYFNGSGQDMGTITVEGNLLEKSCIAFDSVSQADQVLISGNTFDTPMDDSSYMIGNVSWTSPVTTQMADVTVEGNTFNNLPEGYDRVILNRMAGTFTAVDNITPEGTKLSDMVKFDDSFFDSWNDFVAENPTIIVSENGQAQVINPAATDGGDNVTAKSLTITPSSKEVYIGNAVNLTAQLSGFADNTNVSWTVSDETNGRYTVSGNTINFVAQKAGTYTITATADGISASATVVASNYSSNPGVLSSYAITVADTDNGSVSVDKYATEGEKVTLTVSPDKAYKLDELTVTAGSKDVDLTDNGDGTYTFTMPSSNVKVSATFVEDKDYVEPGTSITMTIGSNDFVINNNVVTVPDAAPYIANDRTYVPFRALGEALGAKVVWDNDARTVTYTLGDTEIVMTIGDTTYTVNGEEKSMDVAPEITGDRTYVPVRFVAEGLGFKVTPLYADNGTTTSVVFEK